ncbi:hypothetical protein HK105_201790 [Polyrhizophydium stewartii]|uniref:Ankyrin repeat protein n=1 Tax=Polyrhizophydium stewartii TaxID=2732419 RepID=A0ABR4NFY4_9FUNG|nr:hypothetical protein HK105_000919 [Polyrhizophydium stewartii]
MGNTPSTAGRRAKSAGDAGILVTLPRTRSHWDRLPASVQTHILEAADPLTRFTHGLLLRAELRCLGRADRERLWRQAFECEWRGDLRTLPSVSGWSDCFGAIGTRIMLRRVRAARLASPETAQRVAIRQRWDDAIDFADPVELAGLAAEEGALWLLSDLIDERRAVRVSSDLALRAASRGQLGVVEWLRPRMSTGEWTAEIIAPACGSGNLDLVVLLLAGIRSDLHSTEFVDAAARAGHLPVVRWLADRGDECSVDGIKLAAESGHLAVLEFLRERFPSVFDSMSAVALCDVTDLRVLQWLHSLGLVLLPEVTLKSVVEKGVAESARWICETLGVAVTQDMLWDACKENHVALAEWMLGQPGISISDEVIAIAAQDCSVDVIDVIAAHDASLLGTIGELATASGDVDLIEWLFVRHPGSITPRALEIAAEKGNAGVAQFILERAAGTSWDLDTARLSAVAGQKQQIVALLEAHTLRRSTLGR